MSILVKEGTTEWIARGVADIPIGYVEYTGVITYDPDDPDELDTLMIWDAMLGNIREMDDAEKLATIKIRRISELRVVAIQLSSHIYDFITSPSVYLFALDLYLSTIPAARETLSGRLLEFKNVKDTYDAKKAEINALTTVIDVRTYDLNAGW